VRSVLVDTGPLVALFKRRDRHHAPVAKFLRQTPCLLITTWLVATEAWHLLSAPARLGFVRWIAGGGLAVVELGPDAAADLLRLLEKYRDRPMDLADASLVLLAQKLGVGDILTVDRADFDTYRLANKARFNQVLES